MCKKGNAQHEDRVKDPGDNSDEGSALPGVEHVIVKTVLVVGEDARFQKRIIEHVGHGSRPKSDTNNSTKKRKDKLENLPMLHQINNNVRVMIVRRRLTKVLLLAR